MDEELDSTPATVVDEAGQSLFRLGRLLNRFATQQNQESTRYLSDILVTEAVVLPADSEAGEVTIGLVAERLNVEPSTASRLVAETIAHGYLERLPSATDQRRSRLEPTLAGRRLIEQAHEYQRRVFERITEDWAEDERRLFATLLMRFVAAMSKTHFLAE